MVCLKENLFLISVILCAIVAFPKESFAEKDIVLDSILDSSSAVVVGTIFEIDENAYDPEIGPQTKYTIEIEQVLFGAVESEYMEFFVRGGIYPDGELKNSISVVPLLPIGETFVMFFRQDEYPYHPFVAARNAILRIDESGTKNVVTDKYGFLINVSNTIGLYRSEKVSKNLKEIATAQQENNQSNNSAIINGKDLLIENATTAEELCAFIKKRGEKKTRPDKKLMKSLHPDKIKHKLVAKEKEE